MSKNKPAPRIDLAYNKDLKYPDINDYLKDSMYASNLSEYPDNQRNAVVNIRAIPNTLRRRKIQVGLNKAALDVWVGDLKLFGYNPELELVDRMDLLIDSLNDGDTDEVEGTKVFKIYKRGTNNLNLDLVQNSEIQAYKLPALVNYSITFPINSVIEIYNYIFATRAAQAKAYFTGNRQITDPQFQEKFIDNVYRWEIPAMLRYYSIGSTEPDGFVGVDISLSSILPQYRKKIQLDSSSVAFNTAYSFSKFDLFKLSYQTETEGRMRIKARIGELTATQQTDTEVYELVTEDRTFINSDFYAFSYIEYQHSGFYITYPVLKFLYDLYVSADTIPELSNATFGTFTASPIKQINNLKIVAVKTGMSVLEKNADANNPFTAQVWFTCGNETLAANKNNLKFILDFCQSKVGTPSQPDTSDFLINVALDRTVIAGDFWTEVVKPRTVSSQKLQRTSSWLYRSNAVDRTQKKVLSVFQRLTPNSDIYSAKDLSKCSVNLTLTNSDPITNQHTYRIDISWPVSTNKAALYNLIKAKFVKLSISNIFQEVIFTGLYQRPFYDIYEDNTKNPLFTNLPGWRANYTVLFNRQWGALSYPEAEAINRIQNPTSFFVQVSNSKLQLVANLNGTETADITLLEYYPQTYIALSATEPLDSQPSRPYFCLQGVAMAASASVKNGRLQTPTFYPQFAKPMTNVRSEFNVINPVTFNSSNGRIKVTISPQAVLKAIKKIIGYTSFPSGVYSMYYIMNLNELAGSESLVFTNLMTVVTPPAQPKNRTTLIFVVKHQVR